ncbi:hypothetical protein [Paenibacillus apiarius]|uniref:hypothetical protein n=1 Tax=Paenibacillus apiarius TaxID=46240 RepID=UPI00197E7552|nr:hypothetical protein [Paenibacillus apiarius]MBN3526621.1 hypothetical protein [Paenibacillus apiarius]
MIHVELNGDTYKLEMTQSGNGEWIVKYQNKKIAVFFRTPYGWRMTIRRKCALQPVLAEAIKQLNKRDFEEFPMMIDGERINIRVISERKYVLVIQENIELLVYYNGLKWKVRGDGAIKYRYIADGYISLLGYAT